MSRINLLIFVFSSFVPSVFAQNVTHQSETIKTGLLKLEFNADSALVVINYDFTKDTLIASGSSLKLPIGNHTIELTRPLTVKIVKQVLIRENATTILESFFSSESLSLESLEGNYAAKKYFGVNAFIYTDRDTEIYYQDEYIGTGLGFLDLPYGSSSVEIVNPDFGTKMITVNGLPFTHIFEHHLRPSKKKSQGLAIIPGASQLYQDQHLKSAAFASFYLLLYKSVESIFIYNNELDELREDQMIFNAFRDDPIIANSLLPRLEMQRKAVNDAERKRNTFFITTGLVYTLSLLDGLFVEPKGGYRETNTFDLYLSREQMFSSNTISATVKVNF